jgi:hypothetical protein
MLTKSTLTAAVAAVTFIVSPAFAQSFTPSFGTGNEAPSHYDANGGIHPGMLSPRNRPIGVHRAGLNAFDSINRNGLNAFASVPPASGGIDSPALTGGGSVGYNEGLRINQR